MNFVKHRVVGLLDWPIAAEMSPEVLDVLRREVQLSADPARPQVLSLRLPVCDAPCTEVLSADLDQLRIDLGHLFAEAASDALE
jgi:hypothetical protein